MQGGLPIYVIILLRALCKLVKMRPESWAMYLDTMIFRLRTKETHHYKVLPILPPVWDRGPPPEQGSGGFQGWVSTEHLTLIHSLNNKLKKYSSLRLSIICYSINT